MNNLALLEFDEGERKTYCINGDEIVVDEEREETNGDETADRVIRRFAPLYGTAKNGKILSWRIYTVDDEIHRLSGYVDGKKHATKPRKVKGKNIGKSNETQPWEQALFEANTMWVKKKNSGYTETPGVPPSSQPPRPPMRNSRRKQVNLPLDVRMVPMLAFPFDKRGNALEYPCAVQPKLDGIRCMSRLDSRYPDRVLLSSRNGKEHVNLRHIRKEIARLLGQDPDYHGIILDGELYRHGMPQNIISGICRKKKVPHPREAEIQYWIFDLVDEKGEDVFMDRFRFLKDMFVGFQSDVLHLVSTEECASKDDIRSFHDKYVHKGYEGLILRNWESAYVGTRSEHLIKYKNFQDAEFEIVGYKEGSASEEGCVVWVCRTESGSQFDCRPRGTFEDRRRQFQNADTFVGKKLTVRYQDLSEYGIPIFPVGIGIREDKD